MSSGQNFIGTNSRTKKVQVEEGKRINLTAAIFWIAEACKGTFLTNSQYRKALASDGVTATEAQVSASLRLLSTNGRNELKRKHVTVPGKNGGFKQILVYGLNPRGKVRVGSLDVLRSTSSHLITKAYRIEAGAQAMSSATRQTSFINELTSV